MATADITLRPKKSTFTELVRAIKTNPPAMFSLFIVFLYVFVGLFGSMIAPFEFDEMGAGIPLQKPNWDYLFGTDEFGRDVYSRVLAGGKISLRIGILVVGIAGTIGSLIGMFSGYVGGWIDEAVMRVTDVFLSVPDLVMALVIATSLGAGIDAAIIGITMVRWTGYARLIRSGVIAEKGKDYVTASRALGLHPNRIIFKHVLPNSYTATLVQATFDFGLAILFASGLSFVGAGAQPPVPEWGALVAAGRQYVQAAWWIPIFPGFAIFGAVLAFNILGDTLRDFLDPKLRHSMDQKH
jgi:peptide/nickel transport system permease protein|tara:strand:+ start:6190 stop:7080 length:891 start_codon:yes stop_codon:yes gene_type:complete